MTGTSTASLAIRRAKTDEAGDLSSLALRSKGYWGYSDAFMAACRDELTWSSADLDCARYAFFVGEISGALAGFHALDFADERQAELEALFVEPEFIGRGIGRALMAHAIGESRRRGARALVIQGDPYAERFYLAAGAVRQGERESHSIPGRQLPLFRIDVTSRQARRED